MQMDDLRAVGATPAQSSPFAVNIDQTKAGGVSGAVYMFLLSFIAAHSFSLHLLIIDPKDVIRDRTAHLCGFKTT